jgi:enamine deaminase RidA (YjgF/YER057c/UK114 family)
MTHELLNPATLAAPSGFSHAVLPGAGQTVYLAGQTALSADGRVEGATLAQQFDRAASNLLAALAAARGQPQHIVSLQIFVTDVDEYKASLGEMGRVYRSHFGRHYPAMALIGVSRLWDEEAKVEIMGVAVVPPEERE